MIDRERTIRDFLYLDLDRLYSLSSQIFEGVASQMIESFTSQAATTESGKSRPFSGRSLEDQVVELSSRTEVRWLHDHMYSTLEEKLKSVMIENPNVTVADYEQTLADCFLLKVAGTAEIADFQRLRLFLEKFNVLGEAIAYSHVVKAGSDDSSSNSEKEIASLKDRNARARARELAKKHGDAKSIAKELGLYQKPELLDNLKAFLDFFGMDPYEIVISVLDQPDVAFRGVLDRKWLRIQPELLRSLYGTSIEGPVTIVGQITHLPRLESLPRVADTPRRPIREQSELNPSMRDAYQNMFKSGQSLEHMFLESDNRVEVIVCPLAVYRERTVRIAEERR